MSINPEKLTERELLVLSILRKKQKDNPDMYFFSKDIANDKDYLEQEELPNNYVMSCGNVLGNLCKKGFANFAVVFNGVTPVKCYQISINGIDVLDGYVREAESDLASVNSCIENCTRFLKELSEQKKNIEEYIYSYAGKAV